MPVISDLGGNVTLLDLAAAFGHVVAGTVQFVNAAKSISDLAHSISGFSGETWVDLGSLSLYGLAARTATAGTMAPANSLANSAANITGQINANPQASSTYNKSVSFVGGFHFPLSENPANAFKLLLGCDVTLVTYEMPTLNAQFSYNQFFTIVGPLGTRITGSVGATAHFAFGFDTAGLRKHAARGSLHSSYRS